MTKKRTIPRRCKSCPNTVQKSVQYCSKKCLFLSSFTKNKQTDCWIWKKSYAHNKPSFNYHGYSKCSAIKCALVFFKSQKLDVKAVYDLSCNNSKCVNPDHFIKLSQLELKKRRSLGARVKISADKENELKNLYKTGNYRSPELAKIAGVKNSTMHKYIQKWNLNVTVNHYCVNCKELTEAPTGKNLPFCKKIECKIEYYIDKNKNGCWIWKGTLTYGIYPTVYYKKRPFCIRPYLYAIYINKYMYTPRLKVPCNERCVNPYHFKTQTSYKILTSEEKIFIRDLFFNKNWPKSDILKKFNISKHILNKTLATELKSKSKNQICNQCNKTHENIGAQFCSIECMNNYLLS